MRAPAAMVLTVIAAAIAGTVIVAQSPPSDVRLWGELSIDGIQITSVPGSGDLVYLKDKSGQIVGPFPTQPFPPQGPASNPPASATSPPCKAGEWAKNDTHLFLCVSVPPLINSTGTLWRRVKFDPW